MADDDKRVAPDPLANAFGWLARVRGDRALHPKGVVLAATTTFHRPVPGVPGLSEPREVDSLLRLSRAFGLPRAVPDILGFALRLHDLHGPGLPQDLLLASSPRPPLHVALAFGRRYGSRWYTGLLPYRVGEGRSILVAQGLGDGRFRLGTARPLRAHVDPLAEVRVTGRLQPPPPEAASFDPILHAAPSLRQDGGALNGLRARSYRASRAERS